MQHTRPSVPRNPNPPDATKPSHAPPYGFMGYGTPHPHGLPYGKLFPGMSSRARLSLGADYFNFLSMRCRLHGALSYTVCLGSVASRPPGLDYGALCAPRVAIFAP